MRASDEKGTFVLTSFSASAEAVPGDQVNLNRLATVNRVTANCWDPKFRPEGALDTRNENGWSPELPHDGPVHLTVSRSPSRSTASRRLS